MLSVFVGNCRKNMKINTNQRKVLRELLNPQSRTVRSIADAVGLAESTVYNYLSDPGFQQALNESLDRSITHASAKLASLSDLAIDTFQNLLESNNTSGTNRRLTAESVLNFLLKIRSEKELLERIERLERLLKI